MATYFLVILSISFGLSSATIGVDISQACNSFSCLKSDYSVDFTVTRAWRSYGSFDPNSITNLANAKAAGIPYNDVYMFPCRGLSASTQVDTMINDLNKGLTARNERRRLVQAQLDKKQELLGNSSANIPGW